jgi:hypothetical protein
MDWVTGLWEGLTAAGITVFAIGLALVLAFWRAAP